MAWSPVIAAAHRLWFGAAVAAVVRPIATGMRGVRPAHRSRDDLHRGSQRALSTRGEEPARRLASIPRVDLPPEVPGGALSVDQILTLMEVGTRPEELAAGLEVLRLRQGELRPSSGAGLESPTPPKVTV
ncbi:MAG: hypothetical protein WBG41_07525 [Acidimicrobiales bacterium]